MPQIKSIDKRTGMVMVRSDRNYKNRNNVLAVRIGGQDWVIVFNERNQRAMRMVESCLLLPQRRWVSLALCTPPIHPFATSCT